MLHNPRQIEDRHTYIHSDTQTDRQDKTRQDKTRQDKTRQDKRTEREREKTLNRPTNTNSPHPDADTGMDAEKSRPKTRPATKSQTFAYQDEKENAQSPDEGRKRAKLVGDSEEGTDWFGVELGAEQQ